MDEPDFFGHRPTPVEHRSYFALYPDPAMAQRIERSARDLGRLHNVRRVVSAGRLHVSMNGLKRGEQLATQQLEDALLIGEAIRHPPFDLVFDRVQTWDGGRNSGRRSQVPTVLCCSDPSREAAILYDNLRRQMRNFGLCTGARSFSPHITLWYAPTRLATRNLTRPLRIRIDRFCLVHTLAGADRPDHLASWPLKF